MKTFKNANYTKRNYECSNVIACVGPQAPATGSWVESTDSILTGLTRLWTVGDVTFYGFL